MTEQYRIITPAQLAEGRLKRFGQFIYERRYEVVKKLPDGNLIVTEPKAEQTPETLPAPIPSI